MEKCKIRQPMRSAKAEEGKKSSTSLRLYKNFLRTAFPRYRRIFGVKTTQPVRLFSPLKPIGRNQSGEEKDTVEKLHFTLLVRAPRLLFWGSVPGFFTFWGARRCTPAAAFG
jgi:hypothetical protein